MKQAKQCTIDRRPGALVTPRRCRLCKKQKERTREVKQKGRQALAVVTNGIKQNSTAVKVNKKKAE